MSGALLAGLALLSALLVGGYRRLALRRHWFDLPNHRSSHTVATPRGAGIVFALLSVIALGIWQPQWWPLGGLALLMALVGWLDDLRGLPSALRFGLYAAGVALFLGWALPGRLPLAGAVLLLVPVPVPVLSLALLWLALLWLLNLFNFMDGINGITGMQALFALLGAALLMGAGDDGLRLVLLATAAAVAGFLVWNLPRGLVFMGDAGSIFLGFWIGALATLSVLSGWLGIAEWLLLLALFIADASYTLAVRLGSGQRWHQPHRSHAYQRLARRWSSHGRVVLAGLAINLLWLLPLAYAARAGAMPPWLAIVSGYLPLLIGCYTLRAGLREPEPDGEG